MHTQLIATQYNVAQEEQTASRHSTNARFAFLDAQARTRAHASELDAAQLARVNKLFELVCDTYNSIVYKNIRKNSATIKVANKNADVSIIALRYLMQWCERNAVTLQHNVRTNSISYVLKH